MAILTLGLAGGAAFAGDPSPLTTAELPRMTPAYNVPAQVRPAAPVRMVPAPVPISGRSRDPFAWPASVDDLVADVGAPAIPLPVMQTAPPPPVSGRAAPQATGQLPATAGSPATAPKTSPGTLPTEPGAPGDTTAPGDAATPGAPTPPSTSPPSDLPQLPPDSAAPPGAIDLSDASPFAGSAFSTQTAAASGFAAVPIISNMGPIIRAAASPPIVNPPGGGAGGAPNVPNTDSINAIVRTFKIAENQSPRPQDRVFFSFNYFDNVNATINRREQSPVTSIGIYRYLLGFEKTFDDSRGSFGISVPLYNQTANSNTNLRTPTSTALGDMNLFVKYILKENRRTGSLLSTGLLVTPPTGPRYLANADYFRGTNTSKFVPAHTVAMQPYLGYIFNRNDFFIQGFSSLDVSTDPQLPILFFNDIQFGYYIFKDRDPERMLTAIFPTFEVHVTNPLTHRGAFSKDPYKRFQYDPYGTPDFVNFTYGLNLEFNSRSLLTFAYVNSVTSPKPFDGEAVLLFNFRFGGSNRPIAPVVAGN